MTIIVRSAVAPTARSPIFQVTLPDDSVAVPLAVLADTKVTPAGNVSVTFTLVAISGPLFLTVRV